jgi:glycerol-3-phosphate acyltransferase PlsY
VGASGETVGVLGGALLAYLLGSISFGLVVARRAGVDLRTAGSGNVGATNVRRAVGRGAGRLVLVLDALKGLAPVAVARTLSSPDHPAPALVGVAAALGHCFPIWHGFRGGKAAATALGVLLAAHPLSGLVALVAYGALSRGVRRASVGSLGGALAGAAVICLSLPLSDPRVPMALALVLLVFWRHLPNIHRLLRGEEPPT